MITLYRQNDPRWANVFIQGTRMPLWRWGCTLTDVCTLLSWVGNLTTPAQLARVPGLFNASGEILWTKLEAATKGAIKFQQRIGDKAHWVRNDKAIKASILGSPKTVTIIQVNNAKHWVAGLGVTPDGKDYWVADPIDGKRKQLFKTYQNITGSAHLILA